MGEPEPRELDALRRDFPRYSIDIVLTYDTRRYVAQRRQPGPGPHTLVTKDPAEIRAELASAGPPEPPRAATGPHSVAARGSTPQPGPASRSGAPGSLPRHIPGANFRPGPGSPDG